MSLGWAIILLPVGLLLLVKGAHWLVDGAIALACKLGMSPLVIGLTVVAMGTSAPEVAASIAAALSGMGDIAVGNVFGSNIANLILVGGLCAWIRPILVRPIALQRDLPFMIGSILVLWPLMRNGTLGRMSAGLLLLLFLILLYITVRTERRTKNKVELSELPEHERKAINKPLSQAVIFVIGGLITLGVGARLTVLSAAFIGSSLGLSEAVIGITIVAVGTSLPELVTCLIAAYKGHDDLSIGNLVGSNIFNTLLVLGTAGMVRPLRFSIDMIRKEYWMMVGVSILFAGFAVARNKISRPAGFALFVVYVAYISTLIVRNYIS